MSASFTKSPLSGAPDGLPILVVPTVTPGTLIHTAVASPTNIDEIWLWAINNHTASVDFAIEWGGVVDPLNVIRGNIPSKSGLFLLVPGLILRNSLIVRAFASVANVISIHGFVNNIV